MPDEEPRETDDVAGAARAAPSADELETLAEDPDEGEAGPGVTQVESSSDIALEPIEPPPASVAELAAACVRFVRTRYGATLDFAPETLSFVDQWVRDASADVARRAEIVDLVQSAAGAYLGEVIRREFGGFWLVAEGEFADWRLALSSVYCSFNPIGMVREALLVEPADGWHAHFELGPGEEDDIERRLAMLPVVEDQEYYAPSTRYDVVSIVVDALRSAMEARATADVTFGPQDYR